MADIIRFQRAASPLLVPLGRAYAGLMALRRGLYGAGWVPRWRPGAPVVSVGNIGWGGSGKTPLASWILGWAAGRGLSTVLLTRGYRSNAPSHPHLVDPASMPEESGDEPLMLARANPGARVIVDPVRRRAGAHAEQRFRPDLYVLDDGFQHMAVERDLDLVLLTPQDLGGKWDLVCPAGSWREGKGALQGATAFLVRCGPEYFKKLRPILERRLKGYGKPVFNFSIAPRGLVQVSGQGVAADLGGERYLLVSGVGDPAQVALTAEGYLGYPPAGHAAFPDHHLFTKRDVRDLAAQARHLGCERILCTPKDAVKLGPMADDRFWTFEIDLAFGEDAFGPRGFDVWFARRMDELFAKYGSRPRSEAHARDTTGGDDTPRRNDISNGTKKTEEDDPTD